MNVEYIDKIKDACICIEGQMNYLVNMLPYLNLPDYIKEDIEEAVIVVYNKIDEVRSTPINELNQCIDEEVFKYVEYKY